MGIEFSNMHDKALSLKFFENNAQQALQNRVGEKVDPKMVELFERNFQNFSEQQALDSKFADSRYAQVQTVVPIFLDRQVMFKDSLLISKTKPKFLVSGFC